MHKAKIKPSNKTVACKIIFLGEYNDNVEIKAQSYLRELGAYKEIKGKKHIKNDWL